MHVAITGASSGIGEALAREYMAKGASLTLVARRAERLQALASEAPDRTHVVVADLSIVERATDWIAAAERQLGPIDVLVNNAGASMVHPTVATDWGEAEALLRLNVLTPFNTIGMYRGWVTTAGALAVATHGEVHQLGSLPR